MSELDEHCEDFLVTLGEEIDFEVRSLPAIWIWRKLISLRLTIVTGR